VERTIDPAIRLHYLILMTVSAQYAATHFDEILSAAENGEEVRIDRPDNPGIRLVVEEEPAWQAPRTTGRRRLFGAGKGLVAPPSDAEWHAMKKELEADMLNGAVFPPDHA
jgi:antitoxin (DNA-binding transcriptional repressor) of toxin-antitoxin stability system